MPRRMGQRGASDGDLAGWIMARVRGIPPGFVCTYGDIHPGAPRLVGRVLATTTARLPWHRVVRADGAVPMGARQLDRLRREGVPLRGDRVDMRAARLPAAWLTRAHPGDAAAPPGAPVPAPVLPTRGGEPSRGGGPAHPSAHGRMPGLPG